MVILLAVESGSRAWGFPSVDSDYDVRFIYAGRRERYLSIVPGRDVIELPVGPVLDVNGWDVRKALQLLRKSNNALLEWLASPIRYRCREQLFASFQAVVPAGFQRERSARHYLSMARSNMRKIDEDQVRVKSYLYSLRPLLCCRWVLERDGPPPMLFRELVAEYLADTETGEVILALVAAKESQTEQERTPKIPLLNAYLAAEFDRLAALIPEEGALPDVAPFDEAFRRIVAQVDAI